jgi:hypothetical protein
MDIDTAITIANNVVDEKPIDSALVELLETFWAHYSPFVTNHITKKLQNYSDLKNTYTCCLTSKFAFSFVNQKRLGTIQIQILKN